MAMPHPDISVVSWVQALSWPLPTPAFRAPITLLPQTPNSAFPHLCAFAQAALLPPVNPNFSFRAFHSSPSSLWLPKAWGGARSGSKTLGVERGPICP